MKTGTLSFKVSQRAGHYCRAIPLSQNAFAMPLIQPSLDLTSKQPEMLRFDLCGPWFGMRFAPIDFREPVLLQQVSRH